ncbi:Regulator of G protein signaling superfamily [Cordyceps javanica]|uniref:Regulator of G protein signaling superfamily n=1 Tax=Cordyceps javanica TaxID=43265 RepID=A0A545VK27_9HYPO|nr:Regulator of G protein signaling superfamily [Cordyceps javanica]TQW02093.1 Regulator of G protein signaling superfamily [Cordyceps javanica]
MGSELGNTAETKPETRLNGLGVFYIVFAIVWTLTLFGGMAYLWLRRNTQILRIRGLPISFAGILLMHVYWVCATTGYVYGPLMPEVAEYWIMGIWLPLGIALFHASNTRFLYVANAQKKYAKRTTEPYRIFTRRPGRVSLREAVKVWWQQLDYSNKTLATVGVGMSLHVSLTVFMFLISRKFHDSYGINGTEVTGTPMERKVAQGRGWEWWPSIFWQLFWAWIVAPVILFRSRNVHDTQGWRLQTIGCCLSGLHAAPMWLIALYAPGMGPVNNYFIPPMWIAVSIMFLEIFTVFVPIWEVRKARNLSQETLESIARWESRQRFGGGGGAKDVKSMHSEVSGTTWASRMSRAAPSVGSSSGGSILTMDALEHTLEKNPEPLQEFSALKDFSGENVAFLMRVRDWKIEHSITVPKSLGSASSALSGSEDEKPPLTPTKTSSRDMFESALHIYLDFISSTCAEFQINLSSQDFRKLESIFEDAARLVVNEESTYDPATPFAEAPRTAADNAAAAFRYVGPIPSGFDENVFADAEISIKYLILTNTWPKYVRQRRSFDATSTAETV